MKTPWINSNFYDIGDENKFILTKELLLFAGIIKTRDELTYHGKIDLQNIGHVGERKYNLRVLFKPNMYYWIVNNRYCEVEVIQENSYTMNLTLYGNAKNRNVLFSGTVVNDGDNYRFYGYNTRLYALGSMCINTFEFEEKVSELNLRSIQLSNIF